MLKRAARSVAKGSEWLVPELAAAPDVTPQKLKRAAQLSQQIQRLRQELERILKQRRD